MKINRYFERIKFSPASLDGQGIVAAPKAYFANQSIERNRNCGKGTLKSPVCNRHFKDGAVWYYQPLKYMEELVKNKFLKYFRVVYTCVYISRLLDFR